MKKTLILALLIGWGVLASGCGNEAAATAKAVTAQAAAAQTAATQTAQDAETRTAAEATARAAADSTRTAQSATEAADRATTAVAQTTLQAAAQATALGAVRANRTATAEARGTVQAATQVAAQATTDAGAHALLTAEAKQRATDDAVREATQTAQAAAAYAALARAKTWKLVTNVTFDKDAAPFPLNHSTTASGYERQSVQDGAYHWDIKSPDGILRSLMPELGEYTDVYMSADFQLEHNPGRTEYGMVWREENYDHYAFDLDDRGTFDASISYQDKWDFFEPGMSSAAIRPGGTNRLTVVAEGAAVYLFINERLVKSFTDTRLTRGRVGIELDIPANQEIHLAFDNFQVRAGPIAK